MIAIVNSSAAVAHQLEWDAQSQPMGVGLQLAHAKVRVRQALLGQVRCIGLIWAPLGHVQ